MQNSEYKIQNKEERMSAHFILTPVFCTGGVKIAPTDGCILMAKVFLPLLFAKEYRELKISALIYTN